MSRLLLILPFLTALSFAADVAIKPGVRSPISFKVSPQVSDNAQIKMRMHAAETPPPYDVSMEKFDIIVPKKYKKGDPHGLFIWVSPSPAPSISPESVSYTHLDVYKRQVLELRERQLGVKHPKTLASRNNLAAVLQEQERHAEAEQEHRKVLALREKVLGAKHADVFMSSFNLALCLEAQAKHQDCLLYTSRCV